MRTIVIISAVLVIVLLGCGQRMVEVQSGEKIVCTECGKVIRSDVQTRQVPATEASKYSVHEVKELCPECQVKAAERERQQRIGQVAGTWIWQNPLGNIVVVLNPDGTGRWYSQETDTRWQPTAEGFTATVDWIEYGKHHQSRVSGRLIDGGRRLYVEGFGTFGFRSSQSIVFERLE